MRKYLAWIGALAASVITVSLLFPAMPAIAQQDNLVVPGERIGAVTIGMSERELYDLLGAPTKTRQLGASTIYEFGTSGHGLTVMVFRGTVYGLATKYPKFVTSNGLHVGTSLLEVKARMRQPPCEDVVVDTPSLNELYVDYRAVLFKTTNGRVYDIVINKKLTECFRK